MPRLEDSGRTPHTLPSNVTSLLLSDYVWSNANGHMHLPGWLPILECWYRLWAMRLSSAIGRRSRLVLCHDRSGHYYHLYRTQPHLLLRVRHIDHMFVHATLSNQASKYRPRLRQGLRLLAGPQYILTYNSAAPCRPCSRLQIQLLNGLYSHSPTADSRLASLLVRLFPGSVDMPRTLNQRRPGLAPFGVLCQ